MDDIERDTGILVMNFNTIAIETIYKCIQYLVGYMEERDRKVPKYSRMVGCFKDYH